MSETTFTAEGSKLTVKRTFQAPVNLVWRAWTEAELLDQWWAPKPWKSVTKHMAFTEGGYRLYAMVGPEGEEHWGRTDFASIEKLKQFSGKDSFCDEAGNINEMAPVANFTNLFTGHTGTTEVVITTTYASEEDLRKVIEMGMKEGLSMAFQNLDQVLTNLTK